MSPWKTIHIPVHQRAEGGYDYRAGRGSRCAGERGGNGPAIPGRAEIVAPLADWDDRAVSQAEIAARVERELADLPGARVRIRSGNSLGVGGGDGSVQMAVTGDDYGRIAQAAYGFAAAIEREIPQLRDVRVDYTASQPQLTLRVNRERAAEHDHQRRQIEKHGQR